MYLFGHPWGTRVFRNYKGLSIIFPKIYDAVLRFTKVINFLIPRHRIFESDNFRFPFCTKNSLTWGLKRKKLILRKSQGIYENLLGIYYLFIA